MPKIGNIYFFKNCADVKNHKLKKRQYAYQVFI